MKKICKILMAGCLCAAMTGGITAYADVEKSVHSVTLVAAPEDYANIAVSQVTDYVNVRQEPNTQSSVVGKIYNNCAATILETVTGEGGEWYRIQSGSVNGYIKCQYFITGSAAEALALQIEKEFVTVDTEGLRLREQPDLNSAILTHLTNGARYLVQGIEGDFYKVEVDADLIGYIAKQYCKTTIEFDQAVSLEEERQKRDEENQRKQEAEQAIAALEQVIQEAALISPSENLAQIQQNNQNNGSQESGSQNNSSQNSSGQNGLIEANPEQSDNSVNTSAPIPVPVETPQPAPEQTAEQKPEPAAAPASSPVVSASSGPNVSAVQNSAEMSETVTSATRTAIVAYAKQFLGNPYVYGGTSLTNGTDCSGFTQGIYAHFGITTGRSSRDQAAKGKNISVTAAQPGDLLFYSSGDYINHVAMYIGNGQIIHAGSSKTGICIAPYNYRTPCKAVTFLN